MAVRRVCGAGALQCVPDHPPPFCSSHRADGFDFWPFVGMVGAVFVGRDALAAQLAPERTTKMTNPFFEKFILNSP